jgi:arylsulfatase A-like enzyme
VFEWLARPDPRPGFAFWHIMDVHGPYGARAPFGGAYRRAVERGPSQFPPLAALSRLGIHDYLELDRFHSVEDLIAGYDEGVARVDAALGEVLQFLTDAGLYDDAMIVVTSDHGEGFAEPGLMLGHGLSLQEAEIRVPLLVKLPGQRYAGRRVPEMVRLLDVAPSILDVAGVSPPSSFAGRSLLSPAPGAPEALPEISFGSSSNTGAMYVRTRTTKYISRWLEPYEAVVSKHVYPKDANPPLLVLDPGERVYDLENDPHEQQNLVRARAWQEQRLALRAAVEGQQRLAAARAASAGAPALSGAEVEQLRALGYVVDTPK